MYIDEIRRGLIHGRSHEAQARCLSLQGAVKSVKRFRITFQGAAVYIRRNISAITTWSITRNKSAPPLPLKGCEVYGLRGCVTHTHHDSIDGILLRAHSIQLIRVEHLDCFRRVFFYFQNFQGLTAGATVTTGLLVRFCFRLPNSMGRKTWDT